ncbi:TraB/GumN family protein [Alteripontixanthobacter maritimus]|uniref:TraB/GumN family protein n=1 Tax=Alteripontixanthobacter maritimus TaxID=2161824 RepID=UPI0015F0FE21|nr:TraB/GumN family protein [Alteripontixanthobacter maritimus]
MPLWRAPFGYIMVRVSMVLAVVMVLALALTGCKDEASAPPPEFRNAPAPPIWELRSANGEHGGWLLGTIHSLPDGVEWRSKPVERAIEQAEGLVVEAKGITDKDRHAMIFAHMSVTPGLPPLNQRGDRGQIDAALAHQDMKAADFTATETWAAALMLSGAGGYGSSANGVDRALLETFAPVQTRELEGVEGQLRIFDELPENTQRELLDLAVKSALAGNSARKADAVAWYRGDMDGLAASLTRDLGSRPALRAALVTRRNQQWASTIEALLAEHDALLIAVGAAHMAGPGNLLAELETRGIAARRIR